MKRKFAPQPVAPPETQEPNPPVESVALASESNPEPAPTTTQAPPEILERGDDRYYALHWGINE
ncbi:MAG: hypothetical protein ABSD29_01740 [Verrucomicrobiota bacterium]|jgi:hypothetical protein